MTSPAPVFPLTEGAPAPRCPPAGRPPPQGPSPPPSGTRRGHGLPRRAPAEGRAVAGGRWGVVAGGREGTRRRGGGGRRDRGRKRGLTSARPHQRPSAPPAGHLCGRATPHAPEAVAWLRRAAGLKPGNARAPSVAEGEGRGRCGTEGQRGGGRSVSPCRAASRRRAGRPPEGRPGRRCSAEGLCGDPSSTSGLRGTQHPRQAQRAPCGLAWPGRRRGPWSLPTVRSGYTQVLCRAEAL